MIPPTDYARITRDRETLRRVWTELLRLQWIEKIKTQRAERAAMRRLA